MISLEDIMTRDISALNPEHSVLDARRLMSERGIRHVPVTDETGKLLGLFSHRDLLAVTDSVESGLSQTARAEKEACLRLEAVMTTHVATASKHVPLREAAIFLQNNKYGCLPVVENGKLKGIITDSDFIAVAINLLEQIEMEEPLEREDILEEDFA